MATAPRRQSRFKAAVVAAVALLAAGCVTDDEKIKAIKAVNENFRVQYEAILSERGTHVVNAHREDAYTAMRVALATMGMQLDNQDPKLGYFSVFASAPLPLDAGEWATASEIDLPLLREITAPYIGFARHFLHFEPEGLQTVINVTVLDVPQGASVSLTMRLREIAPPRSGYPRREYAAPTIVKTGLDKIWAAFDRELSGAAPKT